MTADRLKFKNPPINELVVGMFHVPIVDLKAQHIGLYWDKVRDRFPSCEQQNVIVGPNDNVAVLLQDQPGEVFPLPRFWLAKPNSPILVQIQRNAFLVNWRKVQEALYPHFEQVFKAFLEELGNYKAFLMKYLGSSIDLVNRYELTYINVIEKNRFFSSLPELKNIIPSLAGFSDLQSDDRKLAGLNASVVYNMQDNIQAEITVRVVQRLDTKEMAAILELKAFGAPKNLSPSEAPEWFATAHNMIYRNFLDLTDKRIQQELWEPT